MDKDCKKQRQNIPEYWFIRNGNKQYSQKIAAFIRGRIAFLLKYNYLGKETDSGLVRVTSADHFSIFYKIDLEKIIIVSLWDNRQDPDKLIEIFKQSAL